MGSTLGDYERAKLEMRELELKTEELEDEIASQKEKLKKAEEKCIANDHEVNCLTELNDSRANLSCLFIELDQTTQRET